MVSMLLETAVRTGDSGGYVKFVVIGLVCVIAIVAVAVLGILSGKSKEESDEKSD